MTPPEARVRASRKGTPLGRALLGAASCTGWILLGCATPAPLPPAPPPAAPAPAGELRVELEFGAEADLDLVVTDPWWEEVYFGNSPSRLGGVFEGDRRCGDPAPRREVVRFSPAPPGTYRVGVDYPVRCRGGIDEVPYRLTLEANGERRVYERTASFGALELVLELEVSE
jgi:hypothetical protein